MEIILRIPDNNSKFHFEWCWNLER